MWCRKTFVFRQLSHPQQTLGETPLPLCPTPSKTSSAQIWNFASSSAFGWLGKIMWVSFIDCYDFPMKVYTKTGDEGETSLFSGGRVGKDHPRIEAYGTVDELNSVLGLLSTEPLADGVVERLQGVQSVLFSIGSSLADPESKLPPEDAAWSTEPLVEWIDAMDATLGELRAFIQPGGCRGAALAHVARTVCRRAERRVHAIDGVQPGIVPYLNRLSDALFVLARAINANLGLRDPEWRPRG